MNRPLLTDIEDRTLAMAEDEYVHFRIARLVLGTSYERNFSFDEISTVVGRLASLGLIRWRIRKESSTMGAVAPERGCRWLASMGKLAAIILLACLQASCATVSSYSTAARQLMGSGQGWPYYCWRRGMGNFSGSCVEEEMDGDIWDCAHKLQTVGKAFQSLPLSRSEMIGCMHEKNWQEFEIDGAD